MKVKFGDLTINQTIEICKKHYNGTWCLNCPLEDSRFGCMVYNTPYVTTLLFSREREIDLPDEEIKKDG